MGALNALLFSTLIATNDAEAAEPHSIKELTVMQDITGSTAGDYSLYQSWADRQELERALCAYNHRSREARGITMDCNNLKIGAKVILPTSPELRWSVCEEITVANKQAICKLQILTTMSYLDKKEQAYINSPPEAQKCIDHLRDGDPTASTGRLVMMAKGIGEGQTGAWSERCDIITQDDTKGISREPSYDYANIDSKGWTMTTSWR